MPLRVPEIVSPAVLIDAERMEANLRRMQALCDAAGVELWPHIKTHKLVPVLRRQLELGARGATCAKIGEAEAMLPSGVRRIFIAHSLGDLSKAPRLKALQESLDELILAVTSEAHCDALEAILAAADMRVPILMAVDSGLAREGARSPAAAAALAAKIRRSSRMELIGLYTHEGHSYLSESPEEVRKRADEVHAILSACAEAAGGGLPLWPGCSVTAALMAGKPGVRAVRPGAYLFGDLFLSEVNAVMLPDQVAVSILATVVDRPADDLALIDAGSKVFSSDKTAAGLTARETRIPGVDVVKLSEEHGFLRGNGVSGLAIGRRLFFRPAHVCPVMNLAPNVYLVKGDEVLDIWPVDARGRSD